jgi:ribosomal protein S18 acetylase RimI-like enzyme
MLSKEAYRQVASLHADSIHLGFLSSLGTPFLALLYEAIDVEPSAVLLIEENQGRIIGFVSGARGMRPIYRRLLARWPRLAVALLPALASPRKLRKILEILFLGRKHGASQPARPEAELLSIAVAPEARGTGCAERLYHALCRHFAAEGVPRFCVVVGDALTPAHRFYTRMGAEVIGKVEVHKGEGSVLYSQDTKLGIAK